MAEMAQNVSGYIAGLLDGEGCFSIRSNGRGSTFAEISVKMSDPRPLELIRDIYGGSFKKRKKIPSNCKTQWDWYIRSTQKDFNSLIKLLEDIQPYTIVKKLHCTVLSEYIQLRYVGSAHYTFQELFALSKILNQTGPDAPILKLIDKEK